MPGVEESYNQWAKHYDLDYNKTRDLDQQATIEMLRPHPFNTVIELGCGTGKNTVWLAKRASKVLALDFSEEMLSRAREKVKNKQVEFLKCDLNLPWPLENEVADLITCSLTLEHIQDLTFIFAESGRTLKTGKLLFVSELHPAKQAAGSKAHFEEEGQFQELETYTHHFSEYYHAASLAGFALVEMKEWFDEHIQDQIPRLATFVFRKMTSAS